MTREQVQQFFAELEQHWRDRNAQGLADGHADNGTIISPIFRTVTGARDILASYRALFEIFPDWDYRPEQLLIDGADIAEPFTASATHRGEFMGLTGTGKRFTIQGVRLFAMREGRIGHERRYYDFTGLLIQLGVLRSKPGV